MSEFRIVRAETQEERREVSRLRYQVFVEEMGWRIPGATPETGVVDKTDGQGALWMAWEGDTPAGTIALDWWKEVDLEEETIEHFHLNHFARAFSRDAIAIARKIAIAKPYRATRLLQRLLETYLRFGISAGLYFVFTDMSPYLIRFYERLGYRRYAPHFFYDDTGILSVPLCLVLGDHVHLERVRSRLLPFLREHGHRDCPETRRYFEEHWMASVPGPGAQAEEPDLPLPGLPEKAAGAFDVLRSPLFQGLEDRETERLLEQCLTLAFKPRDRIVSAGDPGADLYLLTQGYVEVTLDGEGRKLAIATQGPGDLIGEIGLLLKTGRTADATALTDGAALRIPEAALEDLLSQDPALAARFYRNLAGILAERLRARSLWITSAPPL